jgi:hypothetical protein
LYSPPPRDPGRDHHREPDAVNTRSTHTQINPRPKTQAHPEQTEENGEKCEEREKFRENERKGRKKKLYIIGQNKLKYWLKDEQ